MSRVLDPTRFCYGCMIDCETIGQLIQHVQVCPSEMYCDLGEDPSNSIDESYFSTRNRSKKEHRRRN